MDKFEIPYGGFENFYMENADFWGRRWFIKTALFSNGVIRFSIPYFHSIIPRPRRNLASVVIEADGG